MKDQLYIIDTTSPFFINHDHDFINWSKVPYHHLEKNGKVHKKTHRHIRFNYEKYITKIQGIGYNAVSIDDLCHLVIFDFYPDELKSKIKKYNNKFKKLFKITKRHNLKIFITTDIMFFNESIFKKTGYNDKKIISILKDAIEYTFNNYKEIDGIIFRIGESDGIDVEGDFKSKLVLKSPKQTNKYIAKLLPIFEEYNKLLIFRTWTTGAYKTGDLLWNKKTYHKTFNGLDSKNLIISMKYGEGDFFRYLETNDLFSYGNHKKIIELQTRREYEGFGEYPSFTGWYYKKIYNETKKINNIIGIHVWCQTGGWSSFKNFTFLKKTSFWNELNTFVTLKIFKNNYSVKRAIKEFYQNKKANKFITFLKLSDNLINNLLYDPVFANQKLYFNKLRIPPILHIFWENITITNAIILFYNIFNTNPVKSLKYGESAYNSLKKMKEIADELQLDYDYNFQNDTFELILLCRKFIYIQNNRKEQLAKIDKLIKKYKKIHPRIYKFYIYYNEKNKLNLLKSIIKLSIRKQKKYRIIDRILFNPFCLKIYLFFYFIFKKNFPQFMGNQAMPVSTFFK